MKFIGSVVLWALFGWGFFMLLVWGGNVLHISTDFSIEKSTIEKAEVKSAKGERYVRWTENRGGSSSGGTIGYSLFGPLGGVVGGLSSGPSSSRKAEYLLKCRLVVLTESRKEITFLVNLWGIGRYKCLEFNPGDHILVGRDKYNEKDAYLWITKRHRKMSYYDDFVGVKELNG